MFIPLGLVKYRLKSSIEPLALCHVTCYPLIGTFKTVMEERLAEWSLNPSRT